MKKIIGGDGGSGGSGGNDCHCYCCDLPSTPCSTGVDTQHSCSSNEDCQSYCTSTYYCDPGQYLAGLCK
ncbi:MAG TPA: hypothetical protein VHA52_08490 [Candidatus Babeliaceae bacterium]|nr:hypothetical protein [Candidatus Babeliaceae bacterium]